MNLDDAKLLQEYAKLQFEIAVANDPSAVISVTPAAVFRTPGYQKLRAWFLSLSPGARERTRKWLRAETRGVRQVVAAAIAKGERPSMADIEIRILDDDNQPVAPPQFGNAEFRAPARACAGSGGPLRAPDARGVIHCTHCLAVWDAHEVGFKLPSHEAIS